MTPVLGWFHLLPIVGPEEQPRSRRGPRDAAPLSEAFAYRLVMTFVNLAAFVVTLRLEIQRHPRRRPA